VPLKTEVFDDTELAEWLLAVRAARVDVDGVRVEAPEAPRPLGEFAFHFAAPALDPAVCARLSGG
jgi:hypothetical protein